MAQREIKDEKAPATRAGESARRPRTAEAICARARAAGRVLAFLLPPALLLGTGAGMLGWTAATAAAVLLPGEGIQPMGVAIGLGRWTLVAGLGLCIVSQALRQALRRWRAPIRFR